MHEVPQLRQSVGGGERTARGRRVLSVRGRGAANRKGDGMNWLLGVVGMAIYVAAVCVIGGFVGDRAR